MKHSGEARRAALKLIFLTLIAVCAVGLLGLVLGWAGALAELLGGVVLWLAVVVAGLLGSIFPFHALFFPRSRRQDS